MRTRPDTRFAAMNRTLKVLSDPTRVRILGLLAGGEVCVCHIHETLDIPQPTASRHLASLRKAGIVDTRREGLWIYYRLAPITDDTVQTLVNTVTHCAGHADTVARDRKRLEIRTGCCCVVDATAPPLACCGPPVRR